MDDQKQLKGHLSAFVTTFVWAATFISIKILLKDFSPVEILFFRLVLAYGVLFILNPRFIKYKSIREELYFFGAGLSGVTLYFIFQNLALSYTLASNVSILVSVSPFFTALLSMLFAKEEKFQPVFFFGFVFAIIGIFLVGFNGNFILRLNPLGDILALLSALVWSIYTLILRKISLFGYKTIQLTRKIILYGLLLLLPLLGIFGFQLNLFRFSSISNILNFLFLGIGASALSFVTWNYAVSVLGAVKTSVYIYVIPMITILISALVLHEKITFIALLGVILILVGLYISERKFKAETA